MTIRERPKIVLLGMMGRLRVGGGIWQALHYLVGLERLGYEAYYVEAHGTPSWAFQKKESDAAAFVESTLRRFDMGDRWAFHARGGSGRYYGMSEYQLNRLYNSAAAILNLHGGTIPTVEQSSSGRLIYIDTDPVRIQVEVYYGLPRALDLLQQHCAFFTFGENYGNPDCKLPVCRGFHFKPTRQPVVLDFWKSSQLPAVDAFTTVGNWSQPHRVIEYQNEEYYWSKHFEFLKFIDLPHLTRQAMELALSRYDQAAHALLLSHGWRVRDALTFSFDLNAYRQYITESKAECTVAKDQNVRLRTGWFSDRSATYLASGRPVVTQETGFSNVLPAGQGLFGFSDMDEALGAIEAINGSYDHHRKAAQEIARECFSHDVVLTRLLSEAGVDRMTPRAKSDSANAIPANVVADPCGDTGMKATAEAYIRALEHIGVRVNKIDPSPSESGRHEGPGEDLRARPSSSSANTAINLICCDIAAHFSVRTRLGEDFFRDRYNIGIWLWELTSFPKEWCDRFVYYDEIWAPSSFIASTLSPLSPAPVVHMPFVLEPKTAGHRQRGRTQLGIADSDFVYLFVFNFHSRFQRKNPMAVIDAFKKTFKPAESARLIIKCANAGFSNQHFCELNRSAEGHRITIYDGHWSKQHMSDLTAACDCYVSLHRAEGVGVTIGDAMAAGKPVVATGWSGNMDFMNLSNSFPVRYRLTELGENVAYYRAGNVWAEPSLEHAAEMLRYVFEHRGEAAARGEVAREHIRSAYSAEAIGALIARRLAVVTRRDRFQSLKKALANPNTEARVEEFSDLGEYFPERQLRYQDLKKQLREVVQSLVPTGATLLVVSRGDDDLLRLHKCRAWHFPAEANHQYAGRHPGDSAEAIERLEAFRAEGGDFLLFPNTAFWWLDHYGDFREHLLMRYAVAHRDESCVVFDLRQSPNQDRNR